MAARFRTGDIVSFNPEPCRCGRTAIRLTGVSAAVSVLQPESLPRATHKAKRVEDRRSGVWS